MDLPVATLQISEGPHVAAPPPLSFFISSSIQLIHSHDFQQQIPINCLAKKHVQKTLDDKNKFKVTYIDEYDHPTPTTEHSCKRNLTRTSLKKVLAFECDQKELVKEEESPSLMIDLNPY